MADRVMYDGVNWHDLPHDAELVAGYVNGKYKWPDGAWLQFKEVVRIEVYIPGWEVKGIGDVLNVEYGDAVQERGRKAARAFCDLKRSQGKVPTIYTSRASWGSLKSGVDGVVDWWIADYTNVPHLLMGSVATQYETTPGFDVSVVGDGWPRGGAIPPPPSKEINVQMVDVADAVQVSGGWYELTRDGGVRVTDEVGNAVDGVPFQDYNVLSSDGHRYYFGPGKNGGVFSYPSLPGQQGDRYFVKIFLG